MDHVKQGSKRIVRITAYHVSLETQDVVGGGLSVSSGGDMGWGPHHPHDTPPPVPNTVSKETWELLGEVAAKLVRGLK
jgi:hypothetical protein